MLIVVVVVVAVAAWSARRGGPLFQALDPDLERLPAAEAAYRACMEERGVQPPDLGIFRDPEGGLVIFGPDRLDRATQAALAECDRLLAGRFAGAEESSP